VKMKIKVKMEVKMRIGTYRRRRRSFAATFSLFLSPPSMAQLFLPPSSPLEL
jgi:hypothetical protein